ncbi:hypothetical protein EJ08DRAFT_699983 [Tothia fuscella]|uniref:Nitrogen regulatory protein areA GATA-like domain-containing protein n=1 Tax=Tothia fuscella TaxID=1048955 RepID=A0A9P4TW15_9PEZI|nr:hypothetical protein EJ08DRAFT_699983 [Tothia fuscella]
MAEVISVQMQPEGQYFSSSPIRRSSPSQTSLFLGSQPYAAGPRKPKYSNLHTDNSVSDKSSPSSSLSSSSRTSQIDLTQPSSFTSTSSRSSLTLETSYHVGEDLNFPSYGGGGYLDHDDALDSPPSPRTDNSYTVPSPTTDSTPNHTPDSHPLAEDDTAIRQEPSRHVDYLSHEWREEDIWHSWRHIVSKRKLYGERSRLENASWRTWAKQKNRLKTVPPDSLNWLKDCDVTWLYGPLQTAGKYSGSQQSTEPPSNLSKNNSFLNKKPILKRRSMSEVMLQKSLSASSLVSQAAAAVQAQQDLPPPRLNRPVMGRAMSDHVHSNTYSQPISRDAWESFSSKSTSGLHTPSGEKRHIRFDDKVEQCIAVDVKDSDDYDDDENPWSKNDDSDSSSDDGILTMKKSATRKPLSRTNSRTSFSIDNKTIAKLEPTTLKYRTDSPDVPDTPSHSVGPGSFWRRGNLSPSPSQETLRPSNPSRNFLLDEDDDEDDISWEPSGAFSDSRDRGGSSRILAGSDSDDPSSGLRRTPSGMFMPYDDEEGESQNSGLFGKVVDTVNTAKDIAHVIWNVGWRS